MTGVGITKLSRLLSMVAPRLLLDPMPPLAMGTKGTREAEAMEEAMMEWIELASCMQEGEGRSATAQKP